MAERTRQESREAFILHGYPYRETSLLPRDVYPGHSDGCRWWRGEAQPALAPARVLSPSAASLCPGSARATCGRSHVPSGSADNRFFAAKRSCARFYLNELLLRLLPREDPMTPCFRDTGKRSDDSRRMAARPPRCVLSREPCSRSSGSHGARARQRKRSCDRPGKELYVRSERGPVEVEGAGAEPRVSGRALLDMARDGLRRSPDPATGRRR